MNVWGIMQHNELPTLLDQGVRVESGKWQHEFYRYNDVSNFWVTNNPNPEVSYDSTEAVFEYLFAERTPALSRQCIDLFAFDGAVRVEFRLRKEQVRPAGIGDLIDLHNMDDKLIAEAARAVEDLKQEWFVADQNITPSQIVRVDVWVERELEWQQVGLSRRQALPNYLGDALKWEPVRYPSSHLSTGAKAVHGMLQLED